MLEHTFCHIPGIGYATEHLLWNKGVTTWQDLLETPDIVPRVSRHEISSILEKSIHALESGNPYFFTRNLKRKDGWRLFSHFRSSTAYLDIETTGLGTEAEITTIALYDGDTVRTYVNGRNIDDFIHDIERFTTLVTYNGISFDIPYIEKFFKTEIEQAQVDLRFILAALGCKGGLKGCEKQMGINRGTLDGIDGAFAVNLWREYERYNNEAALETLLAYNVEDTVNLERLLVEAYNRNVTVMGFGEALCLPYPELPPLIHQPDLELVERARTFHYL